MGLGFGEILLILLVVLIVVGPEKLPKLARTLGSSMRQFRKAMRNLTYEMETAPDETAASAKNSPETAVATEDPKRPESK